jgi:hypothetical protein
MKYSYIIYGYIKYGYIKYSYINIWLYKMDV